MQFQWDENKYAVNLEKHGVSFEEAISVFDDIEALLIPDPDHSSEEDRFILLGIQRRSQSSGGCTLLQRR